MQSLEQKFLQSYDELSDAYRAANNLIIDESRKKKSVSLEIEVKISADGENHQDENENKDVKIELGLKGRLNIKL